MKLRIAKALELWESVQTESLYRPSTSADPSESMQIPESGDLLQLEDRAANSLRVKQALPLHDVWWNNWEEKSHKENFGDLPCNSWVRVNREDIKSFRLR